MDLTPLTFRPIWTHGGRGVCRLCGAQVPHGAVVRPHESDRKLFLCRHCAWKLRMKWDGHVERARWMLSGGTAPDDHAA